MELIPGTPDGVYTGRVAPDPAQPKPPATAPAGLSLSGLGGVSPPRTAEGGERFFSAAEESTPTASFQNFPDFTKLNAGRHNASRADTFNTPSRLDRRQNNSTARIKNSLCQVGDMTLTDLQWICEVCFRKEVIGLGDTLLKAIHSEFEAVSDAFSKQLSTPFNTLTEVLLRHLSEIRHDIEGPVNVDFSPVLKGHEDMTQALEVKLSDNTAFILNKVQSAQEQQEKTQEKAQRAISQAIEGAQQALVECLEDQSTKVASTQRSLNAASAQALSEIRQLQNENSQLHAKWSPCLEATLTKYTRERPVNVDFGQVLNQLGSIQQAERNDFQTIHSEFSKMERTLNEDIAMVLEAQHKATMHQLDEIGDIGRLQSTTLSRQETMRRSIDDFNDEWAQTDSPDAMDASTQTDETLRKQQKKEKKRLEALQGEPVGRRKTGGKDAEESNIRAFNDGETMMRKARQALIKPQYNVTDYYHKKGIMQAIARHPIFEHVTFFVILANAVWIAVDTDNNDAVMLIDADPVFQIAENCFCAYFTFELFIRLAAFRQKKYCFRDGWFMFDSLLVSLMIVETWIVTVVMLSLGATSSSNIGDASILRMFRMVKMVRLSRMARLLKAVPELAVLCKAVWAAARSIVVFFPLWLIVIYFFAVVFRQITDDEEIGDQYFGTVPLAMSTLLLDGILPDNAKIIHDVGSANPVLWPILMCFILLASVTLMYMLIGVLVDVIRNVAASEKEGMIVAIVANQMRRVMQTLHLDAEAPISKREFQELMVDPDMARVLHEVGIDVIVLIDMADMLFEDIDGDCMTFEHLVETVLNMRGSNPATVRDIKGSLRVTKSVVAESLNGLNKKISDEFKYIKKQLKDLQDDSEAGSEVGIGDMSAVQEDLRGSPFPWAVEVYE